MNPKKILLSWEGVGGILEIYILFDSISITFES